MKRLEIKGYEVEIYEGYNGDEVFITKNGNKVYSARTCKGQAIERAIEVIAQQ